MWTQCIFQFELVSLQHLVTLWFAQVEKDSFSNLEGVLLTFVSSLQPDQVLDHLSVFVFLRISGSFLPS